MNSFWTQPKNISGVNKMSLKQIVEEEKGSVLQNKQLSPEEGSGLNEYVDSLIVYKPHNVSIELEIESYSAMRYHGQ